MFEKKLEFLHNSCRWHRICFEKDNYNPSSCSFCVQNKKNWIPDDLDSLLSWKDVLHSHQKNINRSWSYGDIFNSFFGKIKKGKRTLDVSSSSRSKRTLESSSSSRSTENTPVSQISQPPAKRPTTDSPSTKDIMKKLTFLSLNMIKISQISSLIKD